MSDVQATTQQQGAAAPMDVETQFQSLYDGGAFEPEKRVDQSGAQDAAQTSQDRAGADGATDQGQDGGKAAPAQDGQQTQAQDDAPEYSSLDDLLTSMKLDPQSVMKLNVTTKVDGVETQVPLEQVLKSYQLEGHVNNKSIEVSNQRAALEAERTQFKTAAQQAIQQHQTMANVAMQMLNHDFNRIDWNALRAQNPAEYAALQAEFGQRQQQIQGFLAQVQQTAQQEAAQQQQAMQQSLSQERDKLYNAIPEWRNESAFTKDREQIAQYARNLGFQDAELNQIFDHRYMRVLHDAARYRALQAATPQALKQVRQAPPAAAPGSRTNANPQAARQQAALDRFNRNPNDEDAQAGVFSLFSD